MLSTPVEIWCHCDDEAGLVEELKAAGLYSWLKETREGYRLSGDNTPIVRNGDELVAGLAVRDQSKLQALQKITALGMFSQAGTFTEFFPGARDIFDRVYIPKNREPAEVEGAGIISPAPLAKPGGMALKFIAPDASAIASRRL